MPVSLTIQEGKDSGREFRFDQSEVTIGRTEDNDVILSDAGVSRRHAVIRSGGGRVVAQDMGSANGTQVNGAPIREQELKSGDVLAVGPVVLAIEIDNSGSTRILDASEVAPRAQKPGAAAKSNGASKSLSRRAPGLAASSRPALESGGASLAPAPRKALASLPKAKGALGKLSASERARLQRENTGLKGKIRLFLMDKPPAVRYALAGTAALLALSLAVVIARAAMPRRGPAFIGNADRTNEHFPLGDQAAKEVYGWGEALGVTTPTRDALHLDFEYSETIPMVYYLSFEALGIERSDEVEISVNGQHLANINPGLGDYSRAQRLRLPKRYLRAGITNEIDFENTANLAAAQKQSTAPPETWAVSRIQLIMKPVPGCASSAECLREAKAIYDLADQRLSMKDVAAGNRYEAWQLLQKSVLFMETVEPKPEIYNLANQAIRDVERELDSLCSKTMLAGRRSEELNDGLRALVEYRNGLLWYPGSEHPCRGKLVENIERYGEAAMAPTGN